MKKISYIILSTLLVLVSCKKQTEKNNQSDMLPPVISANDLPEFVNKYKLFYPGSEAHKTEGGFLLKSFDELENIEKFYREKATAAGFTEIAVIRQHEGVLLQYRNDKENTVLSADVQKLPYARNKLIRLGFSRVDPSVLKGGNNAEKTN